MVGPAVTVMETAGNEALDAPLAAQARLIGQQVMEEVQVRPAGVLGFLQDFVELLGAHWDA